MKLIVIVVVALAATHLAAASQERVLRRVAKSVGSSERFASFGKRSLSEPAPNQASPQLAGSESKSSAQLYPNSKTEVEPLSSAPSSWQVMSALEAPTSPNVQGDLSASSSDDASSLLSQGDFLRSPSAATKSGSFSAGETFSRLRQETSKTSRQQQQSFFQPPKQRAPPSKTSNLQATKTNWYQPPSPRPAPIVQEQFEQQQNEQYVEQQQVESAPPGQAEPFAFDFNTQDNSGNGQYRKEESDNNGVVRGAYGFRDASGIYRHVEYVADQNGFRANIKSNEPGVEAGPKSQPASIRLNGGGATPEQSQRFTSSNSENTDWSATSSSEEHANSALAPPNFESSHKPERIRASRQSGL